MLKRVGPHRLFIGDITRGALVGLCGTGKADLAYCDPPGDVKMVKWPHSKFHAADTTWRGFLVALADGLAGYCAGPVAVEMSEAVSEGGLPAMMEVRGFRTLSSVPLPARKKGSLRVLWYGTRGPDSPLSAPAESAGPAWFLAGYGRPGAVVLDPCVGDGATARAAVAAGMSVWGADVEPKKVLATKRLLEELSGVAK
jgi:hypothetical protein